MTVLEIDALFKSRCGGIGVMPLTLVSSETRPAITYPR
jgi:hypothetical protein